jgi:hypothetical protein
MKMLFPYISLAIAIALSPMNPGMAQETVEVPVETMLKIKAYIIELQGKYNILVDELNKKDLALNVALDEIARLKKRSSGFWLGAAAGVPFPTATASTMYVINNSIGIVLNGGYSSGAMIQGGVMVRVGK